MKTDILKTFIQLRERLHREKAAAKSRLLEINQALQQPAVAASPAPRMTKAIPRTPTAAASPLTGLSLGQAVVQVTSRQPMTKEEILEAVQAAGYRFSTKTPIKSLNPVLYGKKPKFIRNDGKFSPATTAASKAPAGVVKKTTGARKRKPISPEARKRLSAAAKARWAKARAFGKKKL